MILAPGREVPGSIPGVALALTYRLAVLLLLSPVHPPLAWPLSCLGDSHGSGLDTSMARKRRGLAPRVSQSSDTPGPAKASPGPQVAGSTGPKLPYSPPNGPWRGPPGSRLGHNRAQAGPQLAGPAGPSLLYRAPSAPLGWGDFSSPVGPTGTPWDARQLGFSVCTVQRYCPASGIKGHMV
jgi:hypothetical protein